MHIPPFEPMVIKSAALKDEKSFNASFENIRIFGLSDFKINSLDYDLDNDKVDIDLTFPLLRIYANYKIKGKILILQLNGFGTCDGNYSKYPVFFYKLKKNTYKIIYIKDNNHFSII